MTELELSITIEEGDTIRMNDRWWTVDSLTEPMGAKADMTPLNTGKTQCFHRDTIEEMMDFSGEVHLVREDFQSVIDH
jgi:hypothetical protein